MLTKVSCNQHKHYQISSKIVVNNNVCRIKLFLTVHISFNKWHNLMPITTYVDKSFFDRQLRFVKNKLCNIRGFILKFSSSIYRQNATIKIYVIHLDALSPFLMRQARTTYVVIRGSCTKGFNCPQLAGVDCRGSV